MCEHGVGSSSTGTMAADQLRLVQNLQIPPQPRIQGVLNCYVPRSTLGLQPNDLDTTHYQYHALKSNTLRILGCEQ